jgi:hypothetical protein
MDYRYSHKTILFFVLTKNGRASSLVIPTKWSTLTATAT